MQNKRRNLQHKCLEYTNSTRNILGFTHQRPLQAGGVIVAPTHHQ